MNSPSDSSFASSHSNSGHSRTAHITVHQLKLLSSSSVHLQPLDLDIERWNRAYNLADSTSSVSPDDPRLSDPTYLFLRVDLCALVTHYQHLTVKQLRDLASSHGITYRALNKPMLSALMIAHTCGYKCKNALFIFKELARFRQPWLQPNYLARPLFPQHELEPPAVSSPRPIVSNSPANEAMADGVQASPPATDAQRSATLITEHLKAITPAEQEVIIKEWQRAMDPSCFIRRACAVCSELKYPSELDRIHATEVPLHMLRNEDLPTHLLPISYNVEAYDNAILDPEGLQDLNSKGWMIICTNCSRELEKGDMPRLALANWLYYARDRLPQDVRNAFETMSVFEKALISRVRTNTLVCRFTGIDPDLNGASFATGRRHIRGNVISTPMNTARIYQVLPPSPREIADTICALIVSRIQPSRKNIDTLEPVLVRKSRVKLLIQFLIEHNRHYRITDAFQGYSAEHLDALFAGSRSSGIPDSVHIAHIPLNDAIESGVSDYVRRFEGLEGLFMENVSYTQGDHSPQSFREMTLLALQRCKSGQPFLYAKSGTTPVPDIGNPNWLSWAHPNADPFGIGGFHEPRRKRPIGMEVQLRHLLNIRDSFFENDAELAFDVYNIIRKRAVGNTLRFSVPYTSYSRVVNDILRMSKDTLTSLRTKFKDNCHYKPSTAEELQVLRTMSSISPVARHIPGTTAQKIKMRNEIRAIVSQKGSPTLFVTLNPADYYNPIVTVLATRAKDMADVTALEELSTSDRASLAIKHPVACAKFFDFMIKSFVHIILRYGRKDSASGIFGNCTAYYGTVETQGRGSLHCHMLIWLENHLPPEVLQATLKSSELYRSRLVQWLDSITTSGFIGNRAYLNQMQHSSVSDDELGRTREPHPGTVKAPYFNEGEREAFRNEFKEYVDDLLLRFNWHGHSASCWKYLSAKDERSSATCRFGMDGVIRPSTLIDAEDGSILIRRLHPKMTQYNPIITFLMKCNTDIKFIGSGEDAKAFMYYVTDYITKSSMSMHAGLSALSYAIQKGENRGIFTDGEATEESGRRIMTLALNSMLGRQEISHPLVMSYIAGGGENYTSEKFQAVNWAEVLKYVTNHFSAIANANGNEGTADLHMSVNREDGAINVSNQLLDYIYRPDTEPFRSMGLYRHISLTTKAPRKAVLDSVPHRCRSKSTAQPFQSECHPQFHTKLATMRTSAVIPVLLGPRISKNKGSDAEKEEWARDMCILFHPWRHPSDLKGPNEMWITSLANLLPSIDENDRIVMDNMSLIAEGKSARDSRPRGRQRQVALQVTDENEFDGEEAIMQAEEDERDRNVFGLLEDRDTASSSSSSLENELTEHLSSLIGADSTAAFHKCLAEAPKAPSSSGTRDALEEGALYSAYSEPSIQAAQQEYMIAHKNRREHRDDNTQETSQSSRDIARVPNADANLEPEASIDALREGGNVRTARLDAWREADAIIERRNMSDNPEQLRAFEIVTHHVIEGGPQLLMFVGGRGGTGKSYLIQSIILLFEALRIPERLRLGAPTGIAASLIGGNTLHSLLNIAPNTKSPSNQKIAREWRPVRYLIIDEVSMVGAHFMATISSRLKTAKADNKDESQKPFGGINVIFMGDFYQLSPPKQPSLFAHRLVRNPSYAQTRDNNGIDAMAGAYLWRQVNTVVMLKQSKRHAADPIFAELLERIRTSTNIISNGQLVEYEGHTIIEHIRRREISRVAAQNPSELPLFQDAPVIVGSKIIRDALNACLLVAHASRLQQEVHVYYASDAVRGKELSPTIRSRLRLLPTRSTNESLGLLPLFIGMRVMITENISVPHKVVNGSEGVVTGITWSLDGYDNRVADVVYVQVPKCEIQAPGLAKGIVPIFPTSVSISFPIKIGQHTAKSFRRRQIPLVPAYAYTDYKSQGRTLTRAIVDITSARGQGIYVMLSRVTSLKGLLILRLAAYPCFARELRVSRRPILHRRHPPPNLRSAAPGSR